MDIALVDVPDVSRHLLYNLKELYVLSFKPF